MNPTDTPLSFLAARILGVLVEKEKTTPDAYPLTLNSLTLGCNQKSAREPVISAPESEVQAALEELRSRVLVIESYGASGRVLRYAQNFGKVYGLPPASVALLAMLALRGAQTVSELRANCERLYRFDDGSSVEAYLEELAERSRGALVAKLPKQIGAREHRWTHLLCGAVAASAQAGAAARERAAAPDQLEQRLTRLESEVADLRSMIQRLLPVAGTPDSRGNDA
ncbi:MAG TPA: YceH family protein [Accumulibacter sp.]|uniref:YceH family protein n=1 Tax=Accumulibacter sp. TaxID=2053492 RepID=UPI0025E97C8C|nr:YceH family protein [Accumulibacter sp.]MCM8663704.1 YceH family protein [Accumulibacter sp.]HNC51103.1 YceH family protein [Accumulibacter sp.]